MLCFEIVLAVVSCLNRSGCRVRPKGCMWWSHSAQRDCQTASFPVIQCDRGCLGAGLKPSSLIARLFGCEPTLSLQQTVTIGIALRRSARLLPTHPPTRCPLIRHPPGHSDTVCHQQVPHTTPSSGRCRRHHLSQDATLLLLPRRLGLSIDVSFPCALAIIGSQWVDVHVATILPSHSACCLSTLPRPLLPVLHLPRHAHDSPTTLRSGEWLTLPRSGRRSKMPAHGTALSSGRRFTLPTTTSS